MDGGVKKGDLFFAIVAAAVLLALEIFSGLSIDIDLCRGCGVDENPLNSIVSRYVGGVNDCCFGSRQALSDVYKPISIDIRAFIKA